MSLKSKNWKYGRLEEDVYIDYESAPSQMKAWAELMVLGYSLDGSPIMKKLAKECLSGKVKITYLIGNEWRNAMFISFDKWEDPVVGSLLGEFYEVPVFYDFYKANKIKTVKSDSKIAAKKLK